MRNFLMVATAGLVFGGCGGPGNGWDGTWMVTVDPNNFNQSGDCVDATTDTGDPYVSLGTEIAFLDVVRTSENTYAVIVDGDVLTGTVDGDTLTVTGLTGWSQGEFYERTTTTLTITRNGGTVTGSMRILQEERTEGWDGVETYTCDTTVPFTGALVTSPGDELVAPGSDF